MMVSMTRELNRYAWLSTRSYLSQNRRRVVPGPLSKAMNVVSSVAPTRVLSPVMGWFYKKMS